VYLPGLRPALTALENGSGLDMTVRTGQCK
jgi:hypothetical protein